MNAKRTHDHDGPRVRRSAEDAAALTIEHRRDIMTAFFSRFPGAGLRAPGLGRALIDFQEWEIDSGRVPDSPWWSAVNGLLVIDLAAVLTGDADEEFSAIGPAAWARFARGSDNPQRSLWEAHQVSIEQGASLCVGLLDQEVVSERAFATFALAVVADSARQLAPTDGAMLGEFTKRHYPPDHPITAPQLDVLKSRLAPGDA